MTKKATTAATAAKKTARPKSDVAIYWLICPTTGIVRYVGKAKNPERRLAGHIGTARNGGRYPSSHWIRRLISKGLMPKMEIIAWVSEDRWEEAEKLCIQHCREVYDGLLNLADGGKGRSARRNPFDGMQVHRIPAARSPSDEMISELRRFASTRPAIRWAASHGIEITHDYISTVNPQGVGSNPVMRRVWEIKKQTGDMLKKTKMAPIADTPTGERLRLAACRLGDEFPVLFGDWAARL